MRIASTLHIILDAFTRTVQYIDEEQQRQQIKIRLYGIVPMSRASISRIVMMGKRKRSEAVMVGENEQSMK